MDLGEMAIGSGFHGAVANCIINEKYVLTIGLRLDLNGAFSPMTDVRSWLSYASLKLANLQKNGNSTTF